MRERPLKVRFCGDCERMILVDFKFCPHCGSPVRPVVPPAEPPVPEAREGKAHIPRDGREARVLLDRLIRELEVLDAEMVEWTAVNGKR